MENTPLVYILECNNEFYKIGYTKTSIEKRISTCQTGNPYEIKLHSFYLARKTLHLEAFLYKKLKSFRVRGE